MSSALTWYLIRAFGLVATGAFTLSAVLGALSVKNVRTVEAIDRRLIRQLVHRSTALIGLAALVAHLAFVLIDTYVPTSPMAVVVPFTSAYRPLAVGLGSLALYALLLAAVSGWLRGTFAGRLGDATWRRIHLVSYLGWVLAVSHGFLAGSDSHALWAVWSYLGCAVAVVAAGLWRLFTVPADRNTDAGGRRRLLIGGRG